MEARDGHERPVPPPARYCPLLPVTVRYWPLLCGRYLRQVQVGMSPTERKKDGTQLDRHSGFTITVASEIMAVRRARGRPVPSPPLPTFPNHA